MKTTSGLEYIEVEAGTGARAESFHPMPRSSLMSNLFQ